MALVAPATARGHTYECTVECAEVGTYAFFALESGTRLSDRACLMLPYIRKLETKFSAGVGALLSLAYPSGSNRQHPCFQLAAVVNDEFLGEVGEVGEDAVRAACGDCLALPESGDGFRPCLPDIAERSDDLFHRLSGRGGPVGRTRRL